MLSFTDLPAELRQHIIAINFPDTCGIGKRLPRQTRAPLHTSHSLRLDTAEALKAWSPVHYVSHSTQFHRLKSPSITIGDRTYSPRLRRICIDLFCDSLYDTITWTCYCGGDVRYSRHDFISHWALAVKHMPIEGIEEVHVDITPAPGSSRPKARTGIIIKPFLYDKRVESFLVCHVKSVGDLLAAIHAHHQGRAKLKLTGNLSAKMDWFLTHLDCQSGLELDHVVQLYNDDEPCFQKMQSVVDSIVTREDVSQAKAKGETHPLAWLQQIKWSKDTKWTYAKLVELDDEEGALGDLRKLVDFKMDTERKVLKFVPESGYRQAFQHRVAKTMRDFKNETEGTGMGRHVVVKKVEGH